MSTPIFKVLYQPANEHFFKKELLLKNLLKIAQENFVFAFFFFFQH